MVDGYAIVDHLAQKQRKQSLATHGTLIDNPSTIPFYVLRAA